MASVSDNFNRAGSPSTLFRALTFNMQHGEWPVSLTINLEAVRDALIASGADIIALQDVDRFRSRSNFVDQPKWLGEQLGYFYAYGENLTFPGDGYYGNAILSRWPILSIENIHLSPNGGEVRGLLKTTISVHGTVMNIYSTHLDHNSAATRQIQVNEIQTALGGSPTMTVVMGDMNAIPSSTEMVDLATTLDDTWAQIGVGNGYTFRGNNLTHRIDYVFISSDVTLESVEVIDDTISDDHLPYRADLSPVAIPDPSQALGTSSSGHVWTNV